MGIITGITMEFQFGTNWSEYSKYMGDIFGSPLAIEALVAFFLESTSWGYGYSVKTKFHQSSALLHVDGCTWNKYFCPLDYYSKRFHAKPCWLRST